jgi:hypothetical protein
MSKGGMTNEEAARAAMHALGEVANLTRGAILGMADEPGYEGIYVREQLGRIGEQAEWLRDHLEDLTDPAFVSRQSKRMAERDTHEGGDA